MGVQPGQVADLLALKGDTSDNIPGAPGIGEKGAKDLILRFGSVEGALEHAAEVEKRTYRESLQNFREQILLSKKLATIHTDVPVPLVMEALQAVEPDTALLRELYQDMDFHSLLRELGNQSPQTEQARAEPEYRQLENEAALAAQLAGYADVAVAFG